MTAVTKCGRKRWFRLFPYIALIIFVLTSLPGPAHAQTPVCDTNSFSQGIDPVLYCFQVQVTPNGAVGGSSDIMHVTISVSPPIQGPQIIEFGLSGFFFDRVPGGTPYLDFHQGETSVGADIYAQGPYGQSQTGTVFAYRVGTGFNVASNNFTVLPSSIVIQADKTNVFPGDSVTLTISHNPPLRFNESVRLDSPSGQLAANLVNLVIPAGGAVTYTIQERGAIVSPAPVTLTVFDPAPDRNVSTSIVVTLRPRHSSYTATYSIVPFLSGPPPVLSGQNFSLMVTLSAPAEPGMVMNLFNGCSDAIDDPLHLNGTWFTGQTLGYPFGTHLASKPADITCYPYYSWFYDPGAGQFPLGSYTVPTVPPQLVLNVAPNASPNGTLHVEVSIYPPIYPALPFDLLSSAPSVIQNRLAQTIPAGGTALLDLPVNSLGATVDKVTLAAQISTPTGPIQATGIYVLPKDAPPDVGTCEDCKAAVGHPINITNGNTYIEAQDYSLPGLGGGISLHRTWNSLSPAGATTPTGPFGQAWRSTYEEQLQIIDSTHMKYGRGDGSTWSFLYVNGAWALQSPANQYVNLAFDPGTLLYTLTFRDGAQKAFNQSGYLISIRDRNGNTTSVTYDSSNRITQVTDPGGRSLVFSYGDGSHPNQVTLISDAAGSAAAYTYDNSSHLLQVQYADSTVNSYVYDSNGLITAVLDNEGKVLEAHTYDAQRRGLTSQRAGGVDLVSVSYGTNGAVQIADSAGNSSSYGSTKISDWGKITSVSGTTCASCGAQWPGTYEYDDRANPTSSTDALGRKTTFTYDSVGDVLTRSIPVGGNTLTWSYTYDGLGNVLTATDPLGLTTINTYDGRGNLLSTTTPAPDNAHPGSTTSFVYDSRGELVRVTDPRGNSTQMTYNSAGLTASITDAQGKVAQFQYDSHGNRTSVTDALGSVTTFSYDVRNRLTKITNPDQTTVQYTYDSRGRRISVTDPKGKVTTNGYDDADRLIAVTDASQHVTHYIYDTETNLKSITDALGRQTTFLYDSQRRVIQTVFPSGLTESYAYDAVGNLLRKTDRNRNTIGFAYDELNRLVQKQYPDSTAVNYAYDAGSRATQVTDATGTYQFAYDNMGRVMNAAVGYSFLPGKTFSIGYSYDAGSNRSSMTDSQGGVTRYSYDTLNRLASLADPGTNNFTFSYDALGRRTQLRRSNGNVTTYQYDSLSRLLAVLHVNGKNTIDGAQYTYDAAGIRTSKVDLLKKDTTANYNYDDVYELVQAALNGKTTETYSYDAVGNRTTSTNGTSYNYDVSNELVSFTAASGAHTYLYDSNGNPMTKIESTGTTTYTWDFDNRLVKVVAPGTKKNPTTTVTFRYDPFGRRIQKVSPDGISNFIYDGANLLEELDANGVVISRYTQSTNVDEPLAATRGRDTRFYQADGSGSITSLTRGSGAISDFYVYDTFGNVTDSHGNFTQPFGFTGRELDSEIGLMYYRARYYDPAIGRFLSEDPTGFTGGKNFYTALANAPTTTTDPSGLFPFWVHKQITYEAAIQTGMDPFNAETLALAVVGVDSRPNSQNAEAASANLHAMTGLKPNGQFQSCSEAYQGTLQSLTDSINSGDVAAALHTIEDQFSPAHAGFRPWNGGSTMWVPMTLTVPTPVTVIEHVPSITHMLRDLSYFLGSSAKAQNAAARFLRDWANGSSAVSAKNYINCACAK